MKKRKPKWKWRRRDKNPESWFARHDSLMIRVWKNGSTWCARAEFSPPKAHWHLEMPTSEHKERRTAKKGAERAGVQLLRDVFVAARDVLELELELELPE